MTQSRPADFNVQTGASRIMTVQMVLVLLVAGGSFWAWSVPGAQAALFGGLIAMLNTWIAGRKVRKAALVAKNSPGQEVTVLYIGAVQRFVLTLLLFIAGMAMLKLMPAALLLAFGLAQLAYLFR